MRTVFFFLFMIAAIWTGIEVMNHGMGGAFGGAFAKVGLATPEEGPDTSVMQRASDKVDGAYRQTEERVERTLE